MAKNKKPEEQANDFDKFLQKQQDENPYFSLETIKLLWEREILQTTNEQE